MNVDDDLLHYEHQITRIGANCRKQSHKNCRLKKEIVCSKSQRFHINFPY